MVVPFFVQAAVESKIDLRLQPALTTLGKIWGLVFLQQHKISSNVIHYTPAAS